MYLTFHADQEGIDAVGLLSQGGSSLDNVDLELLELAEEEVVDEGDSNTSVTAKPKTFHYAPSSFGGSEKWGSDHTCEDFKLWKNGGRGDTYWPPDPNGKDAKMQICALENKRLYYNRNGMIPLARCQDACTKSPACHVVQWHGVEANDFEEKQPGHCFLYNKCNVTTSFVNTKFCVRIMDKRPGWWCSLCPVQIVSEVPIASRSGTSYGKEAGISS